ncbi:MAG TPA: hypothetical protein DCP40_05450 [Stenotrophomonas sp.]|nr:hypothetical protein [Stenotrophomonas sp.]
MYIGSEVIRPPGSAAGLSAALATMLSIGTAALAPQLQAASLYVDSLKVEELTQFQQRPDDVTIARDFKVIASRVGATGNVRISTLEHVSIWGMGPAQLIRDVASGQARYLTITQKDVVDESTCLKLADVNEALGLIAQPPEPTPLWSSHGQRAWAIRDSQEVSIEAVSRSATSSCMGSVKFNYKS